MKIDEWVRKISTRIALTHQCRIGKDRHGLAHFYVFLEATKLLYFYLNVTDKGTSRCVSRLAVCCYL